MASVPDVYRSIVEGSRSVALCFLSSEGVIQSWNPGAEHIFGYASEEAVGKPGSILFKADGAEASELTRRIAIRKDGSEVRVDSQITPVDGGQVLFAREASTAQIIDERLARATEELQRFAFTVSHDLQEPLRTVRSYAELLERRYKNQMDADASEFIGYMVDGTKRMTQLLKDILAYSQAGREDKTRPEPTESGNILQWALMNVDPMVKETGATITHDEPLPVVLVDQNQLAAVFQHLLTNSMKFHSADPPRIHVSAQQVPGGMWEFSVSDNGTGVEPQYTERVFGIFKRLVGREVPGTGIGLSICRKIVEAHGGRMWMESEPGKGSTVRFTLPAYD